MWLSVTGSKAYGSGPKRFYIYSIAINRETMPIGCCVLGCCQRSGLLSTVHCVWPIILDKKSASSTFGMNDRAGRSWTYKPNVSIRATFTANSSSDFYCRENPVSPHTPRLQFHDVIVSLVIRLYRSLVGSRVKGSDPVPSLLHG